MSQPPAIVIMGAGMSGICMGILLKRAGIDSFVIIERSAAVGGTWWDNVYPGAQCDVRSRLYSLSFEPKADWSRVFAPSGEIQAYVEECVDKYGLREHLRLGTTVTAARFDEAAARWTIDTDRGAPLLAEVFIASVGLLNRPRLPAGIDAFCGEVMHSARWNAAYDFTGKRVAIVGSAASAVQITPTLAALAAHLTLFQRTASWILPRPDRAYTRIEKALQRVPAIARLSRWWHYWVHESRYAAFKGRGLLYRLIVATADHHRRSQVRDPSLQALLRPGYPLGCKRVLVTSDFYPALARPNVTLVPCEASGFTASGVIAADGRVHEVDAIVCATGFVTTELLAGLPVSGRDGRSLAAATADGAEAYRGVTVAGFPNLFLLLGPNTGTGHTSVLISIEAQARYVVECIRELGRRGAATMDVRREVMAEHNAALQARLARTVWASPACGSWYKTTAGKVVAIYPGYITRYVLEMRRPRFDDFDFQARPAAAAA